MRANGQDGTTDVWAPPNDGTSAKRKSKAVVITDSAFSGPARVDCDMRYDDLRKLEDIFNESSGEIGLDMGQFRVAMKRTMGYHIKDTELDMMFMKVDTNCDGTVDWDEYLSYMLLEYQEKENMALFNSDQPFPYPMEVKNSNHLESICRIVLQQGYTIRSNGKVDLDDSSSRYLTLSKEGVLNVWTAGWKLQKSTLIDGIRNNPRTVWFTDIVCMTNCNTVAISSTDYEISFFSMTSNMFQKKFQITNMDCCALALDYHYEYSEMSRSVLIWGDSSGSVFVLRFYDNPNLALFSLTSSTTLENKISLNNLVKNHIHNLRVARFPHVHPEWIRELHYYVNSQRQECFISCCRSQRNSLLFADITEKLSGNTSKKIELHRKSYISVRNGVSCVAYDWQWNLIITGSSDFHVRVWNPYAVTSATMILKGHVMPVQHVYVRMIDHHVISVSKDKNIRIWNLLDYSCKQSIHGRHASLGRLDVSALFFNERRPQLVLGSNTIGVFVGSSSSIPRDASQRGEVVSHTKPITKILYNPLFKQVVTGSEDSMVSIWDLKSGEKTIQFCTEREVEVTAMSFDPTNRRLFTGSRNGAINMWNFNNGALLREFKASDTMEVTAVLHVKNRIISAGWNKSVLVHHDSYTDESFQRMRKKHNDDILSMDHYKTENILGTSSYDGDIFIWSLDLDCVIKRLNMHLSIFPIQETKNKILSGESLMGPIGQRDTIYLPKYLPWVDPPKRRNVVNEEYSSLYDDEDHDSIKENSSDKAVNKIMFLQHRKGTKNVAVLLAAIAGYVVAWSLQRRGGILGYFNASKGNGESIMDMETNKTNTILITADSKGYIRVWKISDYCNGDDVLKRRNRNMQVDTFPNLIDGVNSKLPAQASRPKPAYVPMDHQPILQTSFRGHCKAITSISLIQEVNLIASGSVDCSVRLWTVSGRYIGTFGQQVLWNLYFPINEAKLPVTMPVDVRRVGSPTTLYTIKGGHHHLWKQLRDAVGFVGKTRACFQGRAKTAEPTSKKDEMRRRLSALNEDLEKAADRRRSLDATRDRGMKDRSHLVSTTFNNPTEAEKLYERILENGITSNILGRINYKPKIRHRCSKIDSTIKWMDNLALVYNKLPFSDLSEPITVAVPECFQKKIAARQQGATFSRFTSKLIQKRRILGCLTSKQRPSSSLQRSQKSSPLFLDGPAGSEDTTSKSSHRPSSGLTPKTKARSFSGL